LARIAVVVLGVLVVLVGLVVRGIILDSASYVGERAVNPDGTVSYWDPEGARDENYAVRAEDGSEYSGSGPAFVWIVGRGGEGIEAVFEGSTAEEAEAYIRSQGEVFFTGSSAEADAWARAEREGQRSSTSRLPTLMLVGGAVLIVVGLWPGRRNAHATDAPTPSPA
jgi:hypothetical protein